MTFRQFLSRYLIYFAPIMYLGYLVAESYQMDFRAFYVAAKSVLHHLDPYLNPVSEWPELFAAGNADANPASGFRYPPLAALLFMPLGLLAYEPSRVLFSLLNFGLFMLTCFYLTRLNGTRMQGTAILFAMVSFPILAHFERGQIDLLLLWLVVGAFVAYTPKQANWGTAWLLAIASSIKVFPLFVLAYFVQQRELKLILKTLAIAFLLSLAPWLYFGPGVYMSFLKRSLPGVFGAISSPTPIDVHGQGVLHFFIVRALQGNGKFFGHDFVNGRMNPLFSSDAVAALIFGTIAVTVVLLASRQLSSQYQFFAVLTTVTLFNAQAWVMGLTWYIPLFVYCYGRTTTLGKFFILLPLFVPPLINTNGYLAYAIALIMAWAVRSPQHAHKLLTHSLTGPDLRLPRLNVAENNR
jgi:hypothetical protein